MQNGANISRQNTTQKRPDLKEIQKSRTSVAEDLPNHEKKPENTVQHQPNFNIKVSQDHPEISSQSINLQTKQRPKSESVTQRGSAQLNNDQSKVPPIKRRITALEHSTEQSSSQRENLQKSNRTSADLDLYTIQEISSENSATNDGILRPSENRIENQIHSKSDIISPGAYNEYKTHIQGRSYCFWSHLYSIEISTNSQRDSENDPFIYSKLDKPQKAIQSQSATPVSTRFNPQIIPPFNVEITPKNGRAKTK